MTTLKFEDLPLPLQSALRQLHMSAARNLPGVSGLQVTIEPLRGEGRPTVDVKVTP